jgi:hypothetical protein
MSKIICIYPKDSSTRSLNHIPHVLKKNFSPIFHCFKVQPNDKSHEDCLKRVKVGTEDLIIFLGHGQSNKLFGAKKTNTMTNDDDLQYENDDFINKSNIEIFNGKNVFCLSCYSNVNLGKWAHDKGANSFIGFGNIPTDWDDYERYYQKIFLSKKDFYFYRNLITEIVLDALFIAINDKSSMSKLVNLIKILTNNKIIELREANKTHKWVIDNLYFFKNNIALFGDGSIKLIS